LTLTSVAFQDFFICDRLLQTRALDVDALTTEDDFGNEVYAKPSVIDDQLSIDYVMENCEKKSEELQQQGKTGGFDVWCSTLDTLTPVKEVYLSKSGTILRSWSVTDSPTKATLAIFGVSAIALMDLGIIVDYIQFGEKLLPFNDVYSQFSISVVQEINKTIQGSAKCTGKYPGCDLLDCCQKSPGMLDVEHVES
jgi:hypothetical protein